MNTKAIITGIGGQDGATLAARLLRDGRRVIGTLRPGTARESLWRLSELAIADHPLLELRDLPIEDAACRALLDDVRPYALFHFAAQSRVAESFRDPLGSARVNGLATVHLLEAIRTASPQTRFVLASTAEIFGDAPAGPADETTPFRPRNPYAAAKQFAHASTVAYRESFGLHASCAILFNHESPLRDDGFVTRKIAAAAVRLARSDGDPLALGNLDAQRDFGYAPEYVAAMERMAAQERADDYVLATGIATSIRDFTTLAFRAAGIDLAWTGQGVGETASDPQGRVLVRIDPDLFRPVDARVLVGNPAKARAKLGFEPRVDVAELALRMVQAQQRRRGGQATDGSLPA
ncbi:MAG TPA: GDP-mannose 4,6-dehydratase [Rudaea sp.]